MSDGVFTPLLTSTDWNEEWKRLQTARQHSDSADVWDKKAKSFPVKHGSQQGYVSDFLRLADLHEGDSVLDMGCGTGALATPIAQRGHRVVACDFSQGMMNVMLADQEELGVTGVETHLMSWSDDWDRFGVTRDCVDVAIASRSIATYNLKEALLKLDGVARRRACITLPCGPSPKCDAQLLEVAGFSNRIGQDFLYAFNILAQCGRAPEVAYIPNTRLETFESLEDALAAFTDVVTGAVSGSATAAEIEAVPDKLRPWLEANLVEDDLGVHLRELRKVVWAFIAWSTC